MEERDDAGSCTTPGTSAPRTARSPWRWGRRCSRTSRSPWWPCPPTTGPGASASWPAPRTWRCGRPAAPTCGSASCAATRSSPTGSRAKPISDVDVMAKIEDRHRQFWVDGAPVATGLVAVGDAWACTNPSVGRGASIALRHVVALRDALRDVSPADRLEFAERFEKETAATVEPLFRGHPELRPSPAGRDRGADRRTSRTRPTTWRGTSGRHYVTARPGMQTCCGPTSASPRCWSGRRRVPAAGNRREGRGPRHAGAGARTVTPELVAIAAA